MQARDYNPRLAFFSKLICAATLGLIFAGGTVTSKNVGLAVPDWPTSFGYHMWGMPFSMWKGGVFYEHLHRVIASVIGLLVLAISVWLLIVEKRPRIRHLGIVCLVAVVLQGLLGGMAVMMTLPLPISVAHGVLGQVFFVLTVALAYSLSRECHEREKLSENSCRGFAKGSVLLIVLITLQLVVAVYMRHDMKHQGGVAVPDFPTVAERWWPRIDEAALAWVNTWRENAVWEHGAKFEINEPVRKSQVAIHVLHRGLALLILVACAAISLLAHRVRISERTLVSLYALDALVVVQIMLGIMVIWSSKGELLATLHVVIGAAILGAAVLMTLRCRPTSTDT